ESKLLEAHRIRQRTEYDLEMLRELGYCNGIENYSRILDGRLIDAASIRMAENLMRKVEQMRAR
ncbi:MAG TPA: hypothetical protein VLA82_06825, partial [Actinomycetota bacterium]|nr:hypothetical protein [Actinomycetota bacterium]